MSNLLALATSGASLLNLGTGGSIQDQLEQAVPGFKTIQDFFQTWLKLDITTLFVTVSLLGAASSGFASLQGGASKVYWAVLRFLTASISVAGSDRLNREVLNWLGANVLGRQGARILTAHSETIQNDAWHYRQVQERNDYHHEKRAPVQFLPTFGTTWFFHDRNLFMVRRILTSSSHYNSAWSSRMPDEYAGAPEGTEPLVIMCLGRSVRPIKRFLQVCRDFADKQREAFITVRAHKDQYHSENWDTTILRPIRPLETVHFDEKVKSDLVADITNYLDPATRRYYHKRGIPYRRGYLLHGPPGTGKTSLSLALAGHFGLELYLLHIPSLREDGLLERLFTALPPRCIVLLEDIDAVGIKRRPTAQEEDDEDDDEDSKDDDDRRDKYGICRVTLSGLLNVLDGVASQEGRIVCMTSNFADKLDDALTRPGRIDKTIFLGQVSRRSAELMFLRMYMPDTDNVLPTAEPEKAQCSGSELEKLALEFSEQIPENTFTPAQLQGYLLNCREDPLLAASTVAKWSQEEIQRMEEATARAKKVAELKRKKKRDARIRALAKLKQEESSLSLPPDEASDAEDSEEIAVPKDSTVDDTVTEKEPSAQKATEEPSNSEEPPRPGAETSKEDLGSGSAIEDDSKSIKATETDSLGT